MPVTPSGTSTVHYVYPARLVVDPTGDPQESLGPITVKTLDGTAVTIRDVTTGAVISPLTTSADGATPDFLAPTDEPLVLNTGSVTTVVQCLESIRQSQLAAVQAAADAAQAAAEQAVSDLADYITAHPSSGGGGGLGNVRVVYARGSTSSAIYNDGSMGDRAAGEVRFFVGVPNPGKENDTIDSFYVPDVDLWLDLRVATAPVLRVKVADITYPSGGSDSTPPDPPTAGSVSGITSSSITYNWTGATADDVAGYQVYDGTGTLIGDKSASTRSFTRTGLTASTAYPVTVKAYDSTPNFSTALSITGTTSASGSDVSRPTAPTSPSATSTITRAVLNWGPATDADGSFSGYKVRKTGTAGVYATLGADVVSFTDSGLTANTTYTYTVEAFDSVGSGPTVSLSIKTKATGSDNRGFYGAVPGVVFLGVTMSDDLDPVFASQVGKPYWSRHKYVGANGTAGTQEDRFEADLRASITACAGTNRAYPMLSSTVIATENWAKVADGFADAFLDRVVKVAKESSCPPFSFSLTHEPTDNAVLAGVPQGDWAIMNNYACVYVGTRTSKVSWVPIDNGQNWERTSTGAFKLPHVASHWPSTFIANLNKYGGGAAADFYENYSAPSTRAIAKVQSMIDWGRSAGVNLICFGEIGLGDAGYGHVGPDITSASWKSLDAAAAETAAAADCATTFTQLRNVLEDNADIVGVAQYWNSIDKRNWVAYNIGVTLTKKHADGSSAVPGNKITQARADGLKALLVRPGLGYRTT